MVPVRERKIAWWLGGALACAFGLAVPAALAQAPEHRPAPKPAGKPGHKHYAESKESQEPSPTGQLAPRLQNLGTHVFPVSTTSEQAQLFINQGMNLAYGFNHTEAGRSFREAARLDPTAPWPTGARRSSSGPTSTCRCRRRTSRRPTSWPRRPWR